MNIINRASAVAAATLLPVVAFAQATDPFDTALTEITGKVETYGLGLVVLSAVGVVFMIAMKYVKKLRGAA